MNESGAQIRRDSLDAAIDSVASRLVRVDDDPDLPMRIAGALPDRPRFRWLIPQLAALTACAVAAIVWTTRGTESLPDVLPSTRVGAVAALPTAVMSRATREPGTVLRTLPLEPVEPLEPLEPFLPADHERSLPSLEVTNALMVGDVTPLDLPASPALTLAPIGVAELPLTAESFPPR